MSSLLSADLAAACNALGYFDAKSNKYYADANTLETVKDLIRYLRRDDEVYDIRRQLGDSKVLQTDLLPLLKSYWEELDLFDVLLRLIVNLTTPALILWNEELPTEKTSRNFYLQIEGHLQSYKEAFADEAVWAVLSTRLSKILENESVHRGDENSLIIERILILIRNVLYIPADSMEKRPDNDASVHDQVLWALHQSGMLDIILYITSSANESAYYLHILEILSFMLREQNASELAHAALQRSQTEKVRDEAELLAIRHREVNEKQKKSKMFTGTRHSRFGGTFVVKSMKSISDNELIYHKPLGKLDALNFDVDKTKPKTPKNRLPVKATSVERRSAFSIRLFLKEFCVEFVNGAYNTLMYYVKDNLVRAKAQAHDESYYLWAMRFFMEFNRCYKFEVKLVSETMSVQTFHYVQQQSENFYDLMASDKKKLKLWSRRLHLALLAYRELFLTLSAMDKSPDGTVRDSSKVIKSNIFYVLEYREFILTLLINYDEIKMSDVYLKDLIETQHVFLKIMESFIGKEGSVVVQSKSRKKKKRSKKAQKTKNTGPIVQELNLDSMWDETSPQLSSVLESTTEFPTDLAPFDAASDVPIDDQKADAMKNVQRKIRNGEYENAIGLLRAAREVWPENDSFGSPNMAPEEEFLALRDIFFADLGENQIAAESAIVDDVQSEDEMDEEDEEEDGTVYNESNFKFEDFSKRLPHPKIVRACGLALKQFNTNTVNTNHCIIKLLHRIAFDCKMYVMVFQLGIFRTFQKLLKTKDSPQHKELVKFATYIVRQFIKVSETNKKVFMEALFWKSSKECYDIEHGYMEADDRSSAAVRAWTEEQEDEVRRLFMEHQETDSQEDVVDFVTNNLIDQTKSRRQVLKKLKELMLLVNYKKKSGAGGSRAPRNWSPQEETALQELFEQYRESEDPLGNIMDNLEVPRPKNRIVEKLLVMGLIQDKKEVRKKRGRKGEQSRPHNSDNNSNSSDSDEDSVVSQRSASLNVAAPTRRRPKKTVSAKSKKSSDKKRAVKHVQVSKARIAEMLIKLVDLELHEALEWLKESLSDAIEDYEVENNEGIPLVPLMDYAETAIENPEFQRMLRSLGVSPPFDEQEVYWRIPPHLSLDTLQNYTDMIQQALDKTLQIEEELQSVQASSPAYPQNDDSSDDDDVFGKLRNLTKPDSSDRLNGELQNGKVTSMAIDENSRDSVDQDVEVSSNRMKSNSLNRNKSTVLEESDEESPDGLISEDIQVAQENEDIPPIEDIIIKENTESGDGVTAEVTSLIKKKSRIIQESDEESENENSTAISSEQGYQAEETSFSSKTRNFLESDSEGEAERAGSETKRIRSVSDSESEKPAAKRGRILDSDDDD